MWKQARAASVVANYNKKSGGRIYMDLVILAGGMGSRFGGLKQVEPIDEFNNFIIDYSVYDALRSGFDKVVFIIKKENYDIFKNTIGKRIEKRIKVEYVFQGGINGIEDRVKPWGTAHAILCCKGIVKDNFVTINADDFYGPEAYECASNYMKSLDANSTDFGLIGYRVANTLSKNGSAKRGICTAKNGFLTSIVESSVQENNDVITASPLSGEPSFVVDKNQIVSMNMFVFTPKIFEYLEKGLVQFLEQNKADYTKCEYLLPDVVQELIEKKNAKVKVVDTSAVWQGVTYKEDKPQVVSGIKKLVEKGLYKKGLW